jgi:hypothetical protein
MVLRNVTLGLALLVTLPAVYLNSQEPGCILWHQIFRIYSSYTSAVGKLILSIAKHVRSIAKLILLLAKLIISIAKLV